MLPTTKVLCATDFSDASLAALDYAGQFALHYDAELWVLHVLPYVNAPAADMLFLAVDNDLDRVSAAMTQLQELTASHVPDSVRTHLDVKIGYAAKEILCLADDERFDVIVMSTHGHSGWRHLMIGSVAEAVAHAAPCPVLTVRQRHDGRLPMFGAVNKILCPTDFSESSFAAIGAAGELAVEWDAQLRLLHVLEPATPVLGVVSVEEFQETRAGDAAHALLPVIEKRVPAELREDTKLHRLIRHGKAAAEIVKAAKKEGADLIVIATRGLSGWKHLMYGSVAEEVVRTAHCPVLTVHGDAVSMNHVAVGADAVG